MNFRDLLFVVLAGVAGIGGIGLIYYIILDLIFDKVEDK